MEKLVTRVNNTYLLQREYYADVTRLDPFTHSVPCFIHGQDYFLMVEKLISSPASSAAEIPQTRPKRKASKSAVGNLDWQARSFGYASEHEVTLSDIQNLVDQYPGILFSSRQLTDFLESAQYARLQRLKHISQGEDASLFVSHPTSSIKTREHLLISCPRGHQWDSMRFVDSSHPQSPNCPVCGLTWCNVVDTLPSSK